VAEDKSTQEGQEKKGSAMKFIIIGLVAVVVIVVAVVVFLLLGSGGSGGGEADVADVGQSVPAEEMVSGSYVLDTFVVNLNDPGGKRYLKTNIELEYVGDAVGEELGRRLPQLRDVVLLLLSSKSLDEIQTVDGKIALRQELIQRINQILTSGKIRNLYFTQFVIQ
jgi:flagellar FliL protein